MGHNYTHLPHYTFLGAIDQHDLHQQIIDLVSALGD
jgi:hypothetical protein